MPVLTRVGNLFRVSVVVRKWLQTICQGVDMAVFQLNFINKKGQGGRVVPWAVVH